MQLPGVLTSLSGHMRLGDTLHSRWGLCLSSFVWAGWGGVVPGLPIFPNRLSHQEGPGVTLSLDCELIPLLGYNRGTLHAWYWLCSGAMSSALPACLPIGFSISELCHFQVLSPAPLARWTWRNILPSAWGCDSAPFLSMSKPTFRAHKSLSLRIIIREICTPLHQVHWSECISNLVLQISKAVSWNIYLGTLGINLGLPRSMCCLLQSPPH